MRELILNFLDSSFYTSFDDLAYNNADASSAGNIDPFPFVKIENLIIKTFHVDVDDAHDILFNWLKDNGVKNIIKNWDSPNILDKVEDMLVGELANSIDTEIMNSILAMGDHTHTVGVSSRGYGETTTTLGLNSNIHAESYGTSATASTITFTADKWDDHSNICGDTVTSTYVNSAISDMAFVGYNTVVDVGR